jgi:hypothetical protein
VGVVPACRRLQAIDDRSGAGVAQCAVHGLALDECLAADRDRVDSPSGRAAAVALAAAGERCEHYANSRQRGEAERNQHAAAPPRPLGAVAVAPRQRKLVDLRRGAPQKRGPH